MSPGEKRFDIIRLKRLSHVAIGVRDLVSQVSDIEHGYEAKAVKPLSLNHVVLFAGDLREQQTFYEKVLGMLCLRRISTDRSSSSSSATSKDT